MSQEILGHLKRLTGLDLKPGSRKIEAYGCQITFNVNDEYISASIQLEIYRSYEYKAQWNSPDCLMTIQQAWIDFNRVKNPRLSKEVKTDILFHSNLSLRLRREFLTRYLGNDLPDTLKILSRDIFIKEMIGEDLKPETELRICRQLIQEKYRNGRRSNSILFRKYHLPDCGSLRQIAVAMNIKPENLRSILFLPKAVTARNYTIYRIPKKTGGERVISIPSPELKYLQVWILNKILYKVPVHPSAHGFVPGRSILSNASPHVGKSIVINFDLENFFDSISYSRTKGLFKSLGYSDTASKIFALICSVTGNIQKISNNHLADMNQTVSARRSSFSNTTFKLHPSYLPQGSPASPAITNLIARRMDKRLDSLANSLGFTYTRYADDLTFSSDKCYKQNISSLVHGVKKIIQEEGFKINRSKTRFLRNSSRQEVTGLVVNEKININRQILRRFRTLIYQIEKDGISGKIWNSSSNEETILDEIEGFANFIKMVNPSKGSEFINRIQRIRKQLSNSNT